MKQNSNSFKIYVDHPIDVAKQLGVSKSYIQSLTAFEKILLMREAYKQVALD